MKKIILSILMLFVVSACCHIPSEPCVSASSVVINSILEDETVYADMFVSFELEPGQEKYIDWDKEGSKVAKHCKYKYGSSVFEQFGELERHCVSESYDGICFQYKLSVPFNCLHDEDLYLNTETVDELQVPNSLQD